VKAHFQIQRFRVTLRLAVYRPSVRLGDKPLETHDQYSCFPTEHLRLQSLCNILSDERLGLPFTTAAVPRQRSHSHDHILLPQIGHSPNLEGQVPVFISPMNRVARLYPQALGSLFVASYDMQDYVCMYVCM
jgi:hypothetical protein